ncbi:MAG: DUF4011 domain-containing protein [Planctomycetaceae bacterium]
MTPDLPSKFEALRRNLLDLTRRSRLLNLRPQARSCLPIVDELPEYVWARLVEEARTLQFLAREEAPVDSPIAREEAWEGDGSRSLEGAVPEADPSGQGAEKKIRAPEGGGGEALPLAPLAEETAPTERHLDRRLQTQLEGEALQSRLVHLAREARSALEEQGCSVLFLTLGAVRWSEPGQTEATSLAPLLFVPVELERKNVRSRHALRLADEEILTNPSLVELARRHFRFELPEAAVDEAFDPGAYFEAVRGALRAVPGWEFTPEIHLGLFSFAKLAMVRDLDPANWPEGAPLHAHPVVRRLMGEAMEEGPAPDLPDPSQLDDAVPPQECFSVVDADSSQQAVILAAKAGLDLVVEGPPGTGKSQTITNIIAECLAAGRTVLFVAEKAAALEVVKRRLEKAGLGDFVLEMHSRRASKRAVLEELQRSLARAEARGRAVGADPAAVEETRRRLNAYAHDLHAPLGALGLSPFEAMARAVALDGVPEAAFALPGHFEWSREMLEAATDELRTFERRLERVGNPAEHPWRGSGLAAAPLELRQKLAPAVRRLAEAVEEARVRGATLAGRLGAPPPAVAAGLESMLRDGATILAAPVLPAAALADERFAVRDPAAEAWIAAGERQEALRALWTPVFHDAAEREPCEPLLRRRRADAGSLLRWLKPSWHRDTRALRGLLRAPRLPGAREQVRLLEALHESASLRERLAEGEGERREPFAGCGDDFGRIRRCFEAAIALQALVARGGAGAAETAGWASSSDRRALEADADAAREALAAADIAVATFLAFLQAAEVDWFDGPWREAPYASLLARLEALPPRTERLQDWIDYSAALRAGRSGRLAPFFAWALGPGRATARGGLEPIFLRQFYRLWADRALEEREALRGFRGTDHGEIVARFRAADRAWIEATRARVAARLLDRRPDPAQEAHRQSKLGIVKGEMKKKRRHMPLRRLFVLAGDVVQTIKPCFLMSPISVAQYLTPGNLRFDTVLFDEASQVEPADAFGAVARATQTVLIGDEKQLPPTRFFEKLEGEGDGEAEGPAEAGDLESILSLGAVRFPRRNLRTLRWHYRSRHQSLIEFSNRQFYDSMLRIFPSPHTGREELGLLFRPVADSVYLRGTSRTNPVEAERVAEAVVAHARAQPHLSLGVGAFSVAQQRAIEDELERILRGERDEALDRFFDPGAAEPFFVKNLETIQGDERDVILLSVGYGRDPEGRLSMNFGPLNRDGGWRRLNVLVTRARRRCEVFSSIRAEEMRLGEGTPRGVVALKEYLHLAEHGRFAAAPVPSGEHASPLEASVAEALRARGWEVHAQIGVAGFSIDLAVVDPDRPGLYRAGIECDGATYHSTHTARDRDRLRQEVLEGMGWRIERVWSTDWFLRREAVLERLQARLEGARGGGGSAPPLAEEVREPLPVAEPVLVPEEVVPYPRRDVALLGDQAALLGLKEAQLAARIENVVAAEGPIHLDEALRALASRFATRASKQSRAAFEGGLARALAQGRLERRGDFLWPLPAPSPRVRHRGEGCPVTDPGLIPPEEYAHALLLVLRREFGLPPDALVARVVRLMGFARTGPKLSAALEAAVAGLRARGEIAEDAQGFLVLPGA